jgi:hypothetical protein
MNEDKITAYHEAGHIVVNANFGRCVRNCDILTGEKNGRADWFLDNEEIIFQRPLPGNFSPINTGLISREPLWKDNLLTLAAGSEAASIYLEMQDCATALDEEEGINDIEQMMELINRNSQGHRCQELIQKSRVEVRSLLKKEHMWNAVDTFATLLIEQKGIWNGRLPEKHREILIDLITKKVKT